MVASFYLLLLCCPEGRFARPYFDVWRSRWGTMNLLSLSTWFVGSHLLIACEGSFVVSWEALTSSSSEPLSKLPLKSETISFLLTAKSCVFFFLQCNSRSFSPRSSLCLRELTLKQNPKQAPGWDAQATVRSNLLTQFCLFLFSNHYYPGTYREKGLFIILLYHPGPEEVKSFSPNHTTWKQFF